MRILATDMTFSYRFMSSVMTHVMASKVCLSLMGKKDWVLFGSKNECTTLHIHVWSISEVIPPFGIYGVFLTFIIAGTIVEATLAMCLQVAGYVCSTEHLATDIAGDFAFMSDHVRAQTIFGGKS